MNRRERFEKVAAKRVDKILDTLKLLGNCSNPNNYEYTEKDVELMFSEIRNAVKLASVRFESEVTKKKTKKFKF